MPYRARLPMSYGLPGMRACQRNYLSMRMRDGDEEQNYVVRFRLQLGRSWQCRGPSAYKLTELQYDSVRSILATGSL